MISKMLGKLSVGIFVLVCLASAAPLWAGISYDMVTVDNPGNADDTGGSSIGGVGYSYRIGTYDVTIGQYAAFLSAVAVTDTYSLYNSGLDTDGNVKGIQRGGASGSYTYSVIGSANRPITYVSWFDAARFSNWMSNGQGGAGTTETGAYTLVGGQTSGTAPAANAGAAFRLPNQSEWYKAAFYSPNYGGTGVAGYYAYAMQSDTVPGNVIGSGANQANYNNGSYSVTQSPTYSISQNYLTEVGAFTASGSFYGTFDQSGNVFQWNDLNGVPSATRGVWGGYWFPGDPDDLSSSNSSTRSTSYANSDVGFRLASSVLVPEPSTSAMVLAGLAGLAGSMIRRRRGPGASHRQPARRRKP